MSYVARTHVAPGDLGTAADDNQGMDNEAFLYANIRYVGIEVVAPTGSCTTGDGKKYFHIPADLTLMNLVSCHAFHVTAGATAGPTLINIRNTTDAQDMLSTRIMIDTGETNSKDATTAYVIDTAHDDVLTNDILEIDIDVLPTTAPLGLVVTLGFQHP